MTKLCVFMVLLNFGVVSASVYSQNAKLTLKMDNSKLVDVFNSIEEQTDFYFFYNRDMLDDQQIVNVNIENKNVEEVLNELFRDKNISYRIDNRNILIEVKNTDGVKTFQQLTVTGKISDSSGAPLPGVTVVVKGTTQGTITGFDGKYSLPNVQRDAILVFSFVGMKTEEILVAGRTSINVVMEEESIGLEEVVAIGYGTMKKSDLTGSLSSVKTDELVSYPSINPVQALSGKASGVRVVQNSGQPGATISIQIRGGNSIKGDNDPLYVIDGFPIAGDPTMLNTSDIESIDILKDASATAIYGSRGANGVVLITTKSGKKGASKISLDSYYGIQQVINKIDMLDAKQFAEIANLRAANDGNNPYFSSAEIQTFGKGTDWQDEIFSIAPIQNHTITFSGGTEKTKYSLSGSLFDQEGIIKPTDYQRFSIRSNFEQKFGERLTLSFSSIISKIKQNSAPVDNGSRGSSILSAALLAPPTLSPYEVDGNYTDISEYSFSPGAAQNPIALMNERYDEKNANSALTNAALTFEIIHNLKLKTSIGVESIDTKRDQYQSSKLSTSPTGSASTTFFKRTNILNENILTYDLDIDENNAMNLTGGFTYQTNSESSNTMSATGFTTDALLNNSLQSGDTPGIPISSVHEWTLLSWLGRINYTMNDKYLLTASFRADGSSRFGSDNKWGYFPSAAFAWRMTEEEFIKSLNLFSNLKLRASWGRTGSTAISPYQTLNTLAASSIIFDKDLYVDFAPGVQLPNSALKWETTASYNLGFDFGFAKDRIRFTADYYSKKTTDLLAVTNLPPSLGYSSILQNIGAVQNRGIELSMNADILTSDLKWNATLNVSSNKNKVLELVEGDDIYGENLPNPINTGVNITRVGESVGVFYGYLEDGLDENGKIVYKDISGPDGTPDGAITTDDKTIIGNPYPDLIFGFNNDFSYKNFSLNVFIQGVSGNNMWNNNLADYANSFNIGINQIAGLAGNYWTPGNPNSDALYPEISTTSLYRESDRFIEDGSYIRLKNVRLNYNIPLNNIKVNWLKAAQIYFSAQNLLTITNYTWYDPDVSTRGGGSSITPGIDQTAYPSAKTYTFGVHVEF